jgi:hypothetical protein
VVSQADAGAPEAVELGLATATMGRAGILIIMVKVRCRL